MSNHVDAVDQEILRILEEDSRLPLDALATRAGLDPESCADRMETLQRAGHIAAFTIVRGYPGNDTAPKCAVITVTPDPSRNGEDLYRGLESIPEIVTAEMLANGSILLRLQTHGADRLDAIVTRLRNQSSVLSLQVTTTTPLLKHLPWRPPIGK
jgi:DNA-binding Lrp family transcriptional regulator